MSCPVHASPPSSRASRERDRLDQIEERLARIETHLGLHETPPASGAFAEPPRVLAPLAPPTSEQLEREVRRDWFAASGVAALTLGLVFLLTLPHARLPPVVPSLAGYGLALALVWLARLSDRSFRLVAAGARAAAMTLLFFATLRLFFFGAQRVLDIHSAPARAILVVVIALNLAFAWRRRSSGLFGLAVAIGYAAAVIVGAAGFLLPMVAALALVSLVAEKRADWRALPLLMIGLGYATYFAWAIGNPFHGGAYHFVNSPMLAPWMLLAAMVLSGGSPLLRIGNGGDDALGNMRALFNCALGYGVLLLHTAAAFPATFVIMHVAASLALLAMAALFWIRQRSRVSTFFYAMTSHAALSMAIIKAAPAPDVFVWLSLQSVLVVTTAVWFQSRFIVVANFFIYVAIVMVYAMIARRETGISVGFGLVALGTARLLNWQKSRLELKTELMRNTYLVSAFLIFPYSLYHLVPRMFVALAWIALAAGYYSLNLVAQNLKYRWMGHATLLGTLVYVLAVATRQLDPVWRVLTLLALGATLLTVSLSFARSKR
jgi:hypothetical protein